VVVWDVYAQNHKVVTKILGLEMKWDQNSFGLLGLPYGTAIATPPIVNGVDAY
jgi:hypothetical protein